MKNRKVTPIAVIPLFLAVFLTVLVAPEPAWGDWLKTNNPPDVDKAEHNHIGRNYKPSCWVAAASNMLAGASYGDGNNLQERADDIYTEICSDVNDCNYCGWADTAIRGWLRSAHNTWKTTNPYKIVTIWGDPNCRKNGNRYPWSSTSAPQLIANKLRSCHMVRLSIRKPTCGSSVGTGGHAITAWGDDGGGASLTYNPNEVKVSDSDYQNITQNVQTYIYDDYNNPNPDGDECDDGNSPTEGNGWYINYNYSNNHWYIDHIVTLSNTPSYIDINQPIGCTQKVVGSYKIHQDNEIKNALDLHYKVSSDKIYSYRTSIDWDTNNAPDISENNNPPTELTVNWDLSDNNVPHCTDVTITTEAVIPWVPGTQILNPITYSDVNFTYYQFNGAFKAGFGWHMVTSTDSNTIEPNDTGGYIIGAFDIYDDPGGGGGHIVGEYRFIREYDYSQDPEEHLFFLDANLQPHWVGNFRFGHSYAFLDDDSLWQFNGPWLTYEPLSPPYPQLGSTFFDNPMVLDWTSEGLKPYPKAQDYTRPVPDKCGDPGTWYVSGDINRDCEVDFKDMAELCNTWLRCTDPQDANCW